MKGKSQAQIKNTDRAVFLNPWEEANGLLHGIDRSVDDYWLQVKMDIGTLFFPADSKEAQILTRNLKNLINHRIGILKTDLDEQPVVVKIKGNYDGRIRTSSERNRLR